MGAVSRLLGIGLCFALWGCSSGGGGEGWADAGLGGGGAGGSDGVVRACDLGALQRFANCIPLHVELSTCFDPVGTCTYQVGSVLFPDIVYENGARTSTEYLGGNSLQVTYESSSGEACGVIESDGGALTVTTPDGRTQSYAVEANAGAGAITFHCADGSTMTFTEEDNALLQACTGALGEDETCAAGGGEGGGGSGDRACSTTDDCRSGEVCCGGMTCLPEGFCPALIGCEKDEDCGDPDRICCAAAYDSCMTQAECIEEGGCFADSDCGQGICCDGRCEEYRQFCEGDCRTNSDCGGDEPICCTSDERMFYCTADANMCWGGETCDASDASACGGAETGLICCPGADGEDGGCRTELECYGDEPCAQDSDCFGGLVCCTNEISGLENICTSSARCGTFLPCGEGFPACHEELVCCDAMREVDEDYPEQFGSENGCVEAMICEYLLGGSYE